MDIESLATGWRSICVYCKLSVKEDSWGWGRRTVRSEDLRIKERSDHTAPNASDVGLAAHKVRIGDFVLVSLTTPAPHGHLHGPSTCGHRDQVPGKTTSSATSSHDPELLTSSISSCCIFVCFSSLPESVFLRSCSNFISQHFHRNFHWRGALWKCWCMYMY